MSEEFHHCSLVLALWPAEYVFFFYRKTEMLQAQRPMYPQEVSNVPRERKSLQAEREPAASHTISKFQASLLLKLCGLGQGRTKACF